MKTFCTFLLAFLFSLGLSAQSVGFDYPVSLVEGTLSNLPSGELEADWGVINLSANPIALKARRQIVSEVVGSSNYFCWGVCYDAATSVSVLSQTIAPGDTNHTFYAHYLPNGHAGVTTINYRFYIETNTADYAEQTVVYCVDADCAAGIQEAKEVVEMNLIGAQPSNGVVAVQYAVIESHSSFEIWNTNGQLVKRAGIKNKKGQVVLNAQEFDNGVYILRLIDGNQSISRRWVVQH